jgi:hypothetical protein
VCVCFLFVLHLLSWLTSFYLLQQTFLACLSPLSSLDTLSESMFSFLECELPYCLLYSLCLTGCASKNCSATLASSSKCFFQNYSQISWICVQFLFFDHQIQHTIICLFNFQYFYPRLQICFQPSDKLSRCLTFLLFRISLLLLKSFFCQIEPFQKCILQHIIVHTIIRR